MAALLLADILYEAGLPPAMFSVVTGWPTMIGPEMITNPNIDLITFTGFHPGRQGALLPPIVVDRVPCESKLVREETFGPIVPIIRVSDDDCEVVRISNSTAFGLSSGVCTNDFRRMKRYIQELNVGTVNIWEVPGYRIEMSPFGGIKDSGLGYKEGVIEAMKSYTNVKTWSLPWD